jgi:hypothetical protein
VVHLRLAWWLPLFACFASTLAASYLEVVDVDGGAPTLVTLLQRLPKIALNKEVSNPAIMNAPFRNRLELGMVGGEVSVTCWPGAYW